MSEKSDNAANCSECGYKRCPKCGREELHSPRDALSSGVTFAMWLIVVCLLAMIAKQLLIIAAK